jgi:hypothetical protein
MIADVLALPCRPARGLFVVHLFPVTGSVSTPTADFGVEDLILSAIPRSTDQALAPGDEPGGHRLSPRHRLTMSAVPTAHRYLIYFHEVGVRDCSAPKRCLYSVPPFRHVAGAFLGRTTRCGTTGEVVNAGSMTRL